PGAAGTRAGGGGGRGGRGAGGARGARHAKRAVEPTARHRGKGARALRGAATLAYSRAVQVLGRHSRELRDRDLRLRDIGVPAFLPLEAVEPTVPDFHEGLDLAAHRD